MAYFDFLQNQWLLGKLTEVQLQAAVTKGYITQAQADQIKAMPKPA